MGWRGSEGGGGFGRELRCFNPPPSALSVCKRLLSALGRIGGGFGLNMMFGVLFGRMRGDG
jgi:hypothetical protein